MSKKPTLASNLEDILRGYTLHTDEAASDAMSASIARDYKRRGARSAELWCHLFGSRERRAATEAFLKGPKMLTSRGVARMLKQDPENS